MHLFIADLHLSPARPLLLDLFEQFLAGPARRAERLWILGDLFEYWAGDDDLDDPGNARICGALAGAARSGLDIAFLPGNRDFLCGPEFARAAGLTLLQEPQILACGEQRWLILHGDSLCTDDLDYQRFRTMVRDSAWQQEFLARPLAERRAIIGAVRNRSDAEKKRKAAAIMDVNGNAVEQALRAAGVTHLLHGHTHRPARHAFLLDDHAAQRWVLADWTDRACWLELDAAGPTALTAELSAAARPDPRYV
ncbi:MAG: UDP-2,3-diacylglucosamine diphosphatase [Rhodocyclaceae bacterium]|nr:UDP-2,3-diacylglucosamine diphosphatase [Rhodocyclaceae bacterium]